MRCYIVLANVLVFQIKKIAQSCIKRQEQQTGNHGDHCCVQTTVPILLNLWSAFNHTM